LSTKEGGILAANRKDLQNVITDKCQDVDDQTVKKTTLQWKRRLAAMRE